MNDERLGIVRLDLPDGRSVALQLTYARLDVRGHGWVIEQLEALQKARTGSNQALADLLEVFTADAIRADEVMAAPAHAFPLIPSIRALWAAWEIAQYGPDGRPVGDGPANPQSSRPMSWKRRVGRLFGRG